MKLSVKSVFQLLSVAGFCCGTAIQRGNNAVKAANDVASTASVLPTVTTGPGNGVSTPTPTQSVIVGNCNAFYYVQPGDTCNAIAAKYGISAASFIAWNPSAGADCTTLWANAYACVGVTSISQTSTVVPTSTRPGTSTFVPTSTAPGNGIATPTPTQEGMIRTCNKFYFVPSGQNCVGVAEQYGVTVPSLISWNPAVGSQCTNLWANTYILRDLQSQGKAVSEYNIVPKQDRRKKKTTKS
ncbi:hypothetical protein O1611_g288 [Lasiodiplodia mahajangana]|uniref:Uncharacterized protein n=1 Tax=Lasiodiplodia mahajangana TaxID=1108764 RepID=A0ACC2K1E1_9PEZI|nr:hypothetical protein O1611_g288 [Lasiodiplodia mahajangana]